MILNIAAITNKNGILAGTSAGQKLLFALLKALPETSSAEIVYLDFKGIDVATSSFLRESVIAFRNHVKASNLNIYPVVANLSPVVVEEFGFFLRETNDAFWACLLDKRGNSSNQSILGVLDESLSSTMSILARLGSASAPQLASLHVGPQQIGPTGWNNRLASLASKSLVIERRQGKTKTFSPVLQVS